MDVVKKNDVLRFYLSRTTLALLGHLYVHYGSTFIKFCCCEFYVNVFTKWLFLTSTTLTLPIFNGRNSSVVGS